MLGVCSEFERIAKAVVEKAEKDNSGRRKRKSHDPGATKPTTVAPTASTPSAAANTPRPGTASTPTPHNHATPSASMANGQLSPPLPPDGTKGMYNSMAASMSHHASPAMTTAGYDNMDLSTFGDMTGFTAIQDGLNGLRSPPMQNGVFSQPMLPQDLFSLPATLDWDWAEMTGGAYPTVESGNFGDANHYM